VRKDAPRIESMFAAIAPRYDLLNHLLSLNVDRRWRRRAVGLARPAGPVLDVCTGTGDLAAEFSRAAQDRVVGLDFCAPMLRLAKDKKSCRGVGFLRGDALSLPFPADSFDVVSVAFGIRNVADLDAGLAELIRVARPGGRVAVLEFTRPRNALVRSAYSVYFDRVLPFVGNLVSRSKAYSYLNRSVTEWPPEDELARRMERAGCDTVAIHPFTFGVATLHLGVKALGQA
jgi:demethylmenaquinone methyltransferase/2-methoxy-6-polyprenyl-1,4-benzoquinol methylase